MRALQALRRAFRRLVAQETGLPAEQPRHFAAQNSLLGRETQALRLPTIYTPAGQADLQDEDGNFIYMLDYEPLDGGAPLG